MPWKCSGWTYQPLLIVSGEQEAGVPVWTPWMLGFFRDLSWVSSFFPHYICNTLSSIARLSADSLSLPQISHLAVSWMSGSPRYLFLIQHITLTSLPGVVISSGKAYLGGRCGSLGGHLAGTPFSSQQHRGVPPVHPHSLWMKMMSGAGFASPDTQVTTYSCPAIQVTVLPASGLN